MDSDFEEDFMKWLRSESREEKEKRIEKERKIRDSKRLKWQTWAAVWGALTGTLAILYSILRDKGII